MYQFERDKKLSSSESAIPKNKFIWVHTKEIVLLGYVIPTIDFNPVDERSLTISNSRIESIV